MNWDAVGAVGEIVGAVAVVLTLIYLALQVRQSANATQAFSIQTASSLDQEFLLALGTSKETAVLWASYLSAPEKLSDEERLQGAYLMASFIRRLENVYIQHRLGALSKEGWQSRQRMFNGIANSAGYAAYLSSPPGQFIDKDFRFYMGELSEMSEESGGDTQA